MKAYEKDCGRWTCVHVDRGSYTLYIDGTGSCVGYECSNGTTAVNRKKTAFDERFAIRGMVGNTAGAKLGRRRLG